MRFALSMAVGLAGSLAVFLSVAFIVALTQELLLNEQKQNELVSLGILVVIAWWCWSQLPKSIRKSLHDLMNRRNKEEDRDR
jgi:ABC-type nickel/cobalt efflux system permease component RcnA